MDGNRSTGWKKTIWIGIVVFVISFLYAFVRYNIVREVSLEQLPLYITNKAVAMAATIVIGLSFVLGPLAGFFPSRFSKWTYIRKPLGLLGFGLAFIHAIMSLILFNPANYSRFYSESGKLTGLIESSMLFGILAFFIFGIMTIIAIPSIEEKLDKGQWKTILRLGYLAYIFVLLHVALMGYRGWFNPDAWQYGLASITLITAFFIILVLLLRLLAGVFLKKR